MGLKTRWGIVGLGAVVVLLVVGIGRAVWTNSDAYRTRQLIEAYQRGDLVARQKALWSLGSIGGERAVEFASRALRTTRDRDIREAAGFALQKMQAREHYELVRSSAMAEPPSAVQTKLVVYAARLGGEGAMPWLREIGNGPPSWLALGAGLGRLELGDLEADPIVFRCVKGSDKGIRAFAANRIARWIEIMAEAIGQSVQLPDPPVRDLTPEQADRMIDWWRRHVTRRLLVDNVVWQKSGDPKWRRVARLMSARGKAIRFLELD